MIFYGTKSSLEEWKQLLKTRLSLTGSTIVMCDDNRWCFSIILTKEERDIIQDELWYRAEETAPRDALGRPMMWNCRVAFSE